MRIAGSIVFFLALLIGSDADGQVKGTDANSAAAKAAMQKYKDQLAKSAKKSAPKTVSIPAPVPAGKILGASAYDDFIEPVRGLLTKAWQDEAEAFKRSIKEEEARARNAKTIKDKQFHERSAEDYRQRLAAHERNDPAYVNLEALKKK